MTEELKSALLNRDFEHVEILLNEWSESLARDMKAAPNVVERCRILEDAHAFVQQHLYLARVVRANIATELQANSASFLYAGPELEQPRWRVKA